MHKGVEQHHSKQAAATGAPLEGDSIVRLERVPNSAGVPTALFPTSHDCSESPSAKSQKPNSWHLEFLHPAGRKPACCERKTLSRESATLPDPEKPRPVRVANGPMVKTLLKLSPNTQSELKDLQSKWFKLTQMFVLIATNSGLRVGEQKQLRYENVRVEEHKDKEGNTVKLARIELRADTSKVRKARALLCRNGQYFERLKMSLGERTGKSLVFSIDGKREVNLKTLSKYFKTMLEAAEIEDAAGRGIVLYSSGNL